jgi:ribonuclease PH
MFVEMPRSGQRSRREEKEKEKEERGGRHMAVKKKLVRSVRPIVNVSYD